jgi:hypothetical protein
MLLFKRHIVLFLASMAVRPEESLDKMVAALPQTTGKSLEEWREVIKATGWTKHGEIVAGLKTQHGITHGYANRIALECNKPQDSGDPVADIFAKRQEVRPIYDAVLAKINALGSDVDLAPKKGYVSVRRSKQFAILQPAAGRLDVGIQLKGEEPTARFEPSGSFNAMLSHRVRISSATDVDDELVDWLRRAYEAA